MSKGGLPFVISKGIFWIFDSVGVGVCKYICMCTVFSKVPAARGGFVNDIYIEM